jgi:hypothetical protein
MRLYVLAAALLMAGTPLRAIDALSEARRLYNLGQFDAAERAAREAVRVPASAEGARVVLGRIQLERYRRSAAPENLTDAIAVLRAVDTRPLDVRERIELTIGLAEGLYLEDRFGAAAALFDSVLDSSLLLGPLAHERVLDWWATALDREAKPRPEIERQGVYQRIRARMAGELETHPGSGVAAYWLAAAARAQGDAQAAWDAALAGWVRAPLTADKGTALRGDLDRLVLRAIVPDRAKATAQTPESLRQQWEAFKRNW